MMGLTLNAPPERGVNHPPRRPTLFDGGPGRPVAFENLAALARHLHRRRRGQGLRIARPTIARWNGSDTFPALAVWIVGPDGDEHYLATLAVQGDAPEAVMAALAETNPEIAELAA